MNYRTARYLMQENWQQVYGLRKNKTERQPTFSFGAQTVLIGKSHYIRKVQNIQRMANGQLIGTVQIAKRMKSVILISRTKLIANKAHTTIVWSVQ